jgi:hypothetical protein
MITKEIAFMKSHRRIIIFGKIFSIGAITPRRSSSNAAEVAPRRISELCRGRKESRLREVRKPRTQIYYSKN